MSPSLCCRAAASAAPIREHRSRSRGRWPLRRPWDEQPYGEEEITLLEEEVMPAIEQCLLRVEELDQRLVNQRGA